MTKEKLQSLKKYISDLKSKLESPLPEKHKGHKHTYHEFLNNEIKKTQAKIEEAITGAK